MSEMVEKALEIATLAHQGQVDKNGVDYIEHPKAVASFVKRDEEKIVAYLHDVVEDTEVTLDDLKQAGFDDAVIFAVDCISKRANETLEDYLKRVAKSPLAVEVKLADMRHNSDITRYMHPTEKDKKRCENYRNKMKMLQAFIHK